MGTFFEPQTITVDIDDENWVKLRKLTFGEVKEIVGKHQRFDPATGTQIDHNFVGTSSDIIYHSVADWGGPGFDGHEPTPENVAALPFDVVGKFAEAANRINSEVSDAEKKA